MSLHNLTAAARIAGVSRSTLIRALKSGKLSATTNDQGERCVDRSELIRAFGPLKGVDRSDDQPVSSHDMGADMVVDLLREQLRLAQDREQQALERERQTQVERSRLLAMLELEQAARRDLEQRLLPAPPATPPARHARLWILLVILTLVAAALVITRVAAAAAQTVDRRTTVGRVYVGGVDVNAEIVRQEAALVFTPPTRCDYCRHAGPGRGAATAGAAT